MNDGMNSSQRQQQGSNHEFEYSLDDILASANFEPDPHAVNAAATATASGASATRYGSNWALHVAGRTGSGESSAAQNPAVQKAAGAPLDEPPSDRRKRRRALISAPVRVRGINATDSVVDETSTTIDVSRAGILFLSSSPNYARGMEVGVIFPYSTAPAALHAEQQGRVVRAFETPEGRYAVAVALGEGVGEDIVDSCGRKIMDASPVPQSPLAPGAAPIGSNGIVLSREPNSKRPLVLVVDADEMVRTTLKGYLDCEGYDVIAVSNSPEGREVMKIFTPALVIAEVEGEGLPGYDLCAHVKQSPRLQHVPVLLTTSSGYPSDYSNAHALGATVCMTKPYKQERLGHVVRLLAPPPAGFCAQKNGAAAPRPADPSRRCRYGNASSSGANDAAKLAANAKLAASPLKRRIFPSFR